MKSYLVRMTPLIFLLIGRRFCVTQLCSPVSRPGCAGSGLRPGLSRPRWLLRSRTGSTGGVNLAVQATKKTPRLCAEVSDLIY